jgi:hypothetical protein
MCSRTWQPHIWSVILVAGQLQHDPSQVWCQQSECVRTQRCLLAVQVSWVCHACCQLHLLKLWHPWQVLMGHAPWTPNRACTTTQDAQLLHVLGCQVFLAAL